MKKPYLVTTDATIFYTLEVNAESEEEAEDIALNTPLEKWESGRAIPSGIFEAEEL